MVDDAEQDPKLLESGEARRRPSACHRLDGWRSVFSCSIFCCAIRVALVLLAFSLMFWLGGGALCYKRAADQQHADPTAVAAVDNNDAAAVKSYTSYAAAESDMLSAQSSPTVPADDYDVVGQPSDDLTVRHVFTDPDIDAIERVLASSNMMNNVANVLNEDFVVGRPDDGKAIVTKSARFVHDFSANVTGIVDDEAQQCFVMPLMREYIAQPVSLFDLLFKMSSGYYSRGIKQVIGDMRVIKPALNDLSDYGLFISKDCADYSTYRMERAADTAVTAAAAV